MTEQEAQCAALDRQDTFHATWAGVVELGDDA